MFVRGTVKANRANDYIAEEQTALLFLIVVYCFENSVVVSLKVCQLLNSGNRLTLLVGKVHVIRVCEISLCLQ